LPHADYWPARLHVPPMFPANVDGNGHDATHWKNNLWLLSPRIFK
jgi:hypothetical protein